MEEQVTRFEEDIHLRPSQQDKQMEALRAHMIARGIDPDTVPEVELKREYWKGDDDGFAGWEDAGIEIEM